MFEVAKSKKNYPIVLCQFSLYAYHAKKLISFSLKLFLAMEIEKSISYLYLNN